jgi:hypothetical protein
MASWFRSLLGLSAPEATAPDAPAPAADVTLHIPGLS